MTDGRRIGRPNEIPVALVCYNRPWHTVQVVKALMEHDVRNLYVFCDGPRTAADAEAVERVRQIVRAIRWTQPRVVFREGNQGLARSVVGAVDAVLAEHECLILLEDDCVPKRHFFEFMHACLEAYWDRPRVFGINGYTVPISPELLADYPYDAYFYPRIGSWGWATWRRAWRHYDRDLGRLYRRCLEAGVDLRQGGADIPENVEAFLEGRSRDCWTLQWVLAVYLQGGCYVYPTVSQVRNIGFDGSGVHFGARRSQFDHDVEDRAVRRLPDRVFYHRPLVEHYNGYFKGSGRPTRGLAMFGGAGAVDRSGPGVHIGGSAGEPASVVGACGGAGRRSIVHINTHDVAGGAAKVAWRLAEAQRRAGHSAGLLVGRKNSDDPRVAAFDPEPDTQAQAQCVREGLLDYHLRGSDRLVDHPWVRSADVVHLHNLHGHYFNPFSLAGLSQARPTVWTLHDMFAITGHCAYSLRCPGWETGCVPCPRLDLPYALPVDSAGRLLGDKRAIYEHSRLWVVTPSRWLYEMVRRSVLRDHPVELIYNGVDTQVFRPRDRRAARARLGLPQDAVCVGAAANGGTLGNPWKGGAYTQAVVDALHAAGIDCVFVHIGGRLETDDPRWVGIGPIHDEQQMAEAYSALDVFLYTPLADNCPLVVLEAMACGVPVVSFATGGVPELVRSEQDGYITGYRDVETTVQAMRRVLGDAELRRGMGDSARQRVLERFDHRQTAAAYERLYARVLEETRSGSGRVVVSVTKAPSETCHLSASSGGERTAATSADRTAERDDAEPDVSLVLCTKNRAGLLDAMLRSVKAAAEGIRYEVIVIDGGSTDGTREVLARHGVTQVYDEASQFGPGRHGWPVLYNFGFGRARGRWGMYASDDIVFEPGCLARAVRMLDKQPPVVGGGIFFYRNLHTRPDWDRFGIDFTYGPTLLMNYGLVRMEAFRAVGGLDESYGFYCADSDLCLRLSQAGYRLIPLAGCLVTHDNVLDALKQANAATADADIARLKGRWASTVSIEEPEPKRILWEADRPQVFDVPVAGRVWPRSLDAYWHGLSLLQYGDGRAARERLEQAGRDGCDRGRIAALLDAFGTSGVATEADGHRAGGMAVRLGGLVFSKDRAMQLHAVLASLRRHGRDADGLRLHVIYKATDGRHRRQYAQLAREFPDVVFVSEVDFQRQVTDVLGMYGTVLLLVDDNLFVRDFELGTAVRYLVGQPQAIGFSLRLGANVRHDYMHDRPTRPPQFDRSADGVLRWDWRTAEHDFGYPLEVSSSIYRGADLRALLEGQRFGNPNELEGVLAAQAGRVASVRPMLLSFERSVTFCNPVNLVQTVCANRSGRDGRYRADRLAELFDEGVRIDVAAYDGFVPRGCHQEVALEFRGDRPGPTVEARPVAVVGPHSVTTVEPGPVTPAGPDDVSGGAGPTVSVMMVTYNSAETLGRAMRSVLDQTFGDFELLVVDDGSTDDTERAVGSFTDGRVRIVRQTHRHAAAARNRAVAEARGEFILVVDSDDAIEPGYLAEMVRFARSCPDADFYYPSALTLTDEAGGPTGQVWRYEDFGDNRWLPAVLFRTGYSPIPNPGSLIRRSLFARVGGYEDVETVEDFVFLCRHALAIRFRRVGLQGRYFYRAGGGGLSSRFVARNAITARVLDEMVRDYRAEVLCPPLEGIADPGFREPAYLEYVMMTFYALAQVHADRGGQVFRDYGDRYRPRLMESLRAHRPANRCLWELAGRERAEAMVAAARRALDRGEPALALVYLDEADGVGVRVEGADAMRNEALRWLGRVVRAASAAGRSGGGDTMDGAVVGVPAVVGGTGAC